MLASFLMGLVGGQRGMTPLAAVSVAAARGALPEDTGAPPILAHPLVAVGAVALAAAEMGGDKMKSAPDRVVPVGLAARFVTSALAGAALAPKRHRWLAAGLGGTTAVLAAYLGWRMRLAAMPRYGQTRTGLVEDAIVAGSAAAILGNLDRLSA
jgi:uncharacterized membrane protein